MKIKQSSNRRGGFIWIIISILVLIIGAIVIWKLIRLIHDVLPPNNGNTNDVVTYYNPWPFRSATTPVIVVTNTFGLKTTTDNDQPLTPYVFAFQYGITGFRDIWMNVGTNLLQSPNDGAVKVLIDSPEEYSVLIQSNGNIDWYDFNAEDGSIYNYEVYPINTNPCPIVVERTMDFLNWQPLATNMCQVNELETYVDTNAPPDQAFYRLVGYQ